MKITLYILKYVTIYTPQVYIGIIMLATPSKGSGVAGIPGYSWSPGKGSALHGIMGGDGSGSTNMRNI